MIFLDIDGTIITQDLRHYLPPSTVEAIKKARANGHLVFVNTGRVHANIEDIIRNIGFDGFVCGCGTGIYYENEIIFRNKLEKSLCREIALLCRECNVFAIFEEDGFTTVDSMVTPNEYGREILKYFELMGQGIRKSIDTEEFVFDKFAMWYNEDSNFNKLYDRLIKDFDYIDRGLQMAEIVPKGYSKATGIQFLCEYFHIPLENCYAVGDSSNDLSMLSYVPNSIAMGNSSEEVFPVVSFVTKDIEEDGIQYAFSHYGII